MPVLMDWSRCEICQQLIRPSDLVFSSWWGTRYDEAPMHWQCYAASPLRQQLVQSNLARQVKHIEGQYQNLKIVQPTVPLFLMLVDTNTRKVTVLSMDTLTSITLELTHWDNQIEQFDVKANFSSEIDCLTWAEYLPMIRKEFAHKEWLLKAADLD